MTVVALIPARGGSKGIKDKNLQEIEGVTLIGRAVKSAMAAKSVGAVYVSTDSTRISVEAERWGAVSIVRPPELSVDTASSESAILHALQKIENVHLVVFVQCTSPFIFSADIDKAIDLVRRGKYDSVFSSVEDHGFRWELDGDSLQPLMHNSKERLRRQELPERFMETGAFYVFTAEGFLTSGSRFHGRVGHVVVNPLSQIDVDNDNDLQRARKLATLLDHDSRDPWHH